MVKIFRGFTPNPIGDLLSRPMRGLQSKISKPLLQSSEIPNLGLTAQIGNFWLTLWQWRKYVFLRKNKLHLG